MKALKILIEAD